jgi:hypothetical protein
MDKAARPYDVDIPSKFIVYCGGLCVDAELIDSAMGWVGSEIMPRTFDLLNML